MTVARALVPMLCLATLAACSSGGDADAGEAGAPDGATDGARPDAPGTDGTVPFDLGPDAELDAGVAPDADVPGPVSTFCGTLAQALCDAATTCLCTGIDGAACVARQRARCEAPFHDPRLETALTAGTITFDAAAGDALAAATHATPACDSMLTPLALPLSALTTLGGTFVGSVAHGAACTAVLDGNVAPNTCAPSDTCEDDGAGGRVCTTSLAGLGAACTDRTSCADLTSGIAAPVFGECLSSTCVALGVDGAACGGDGECASSVCTTGQCQGPFPVGHACTVATQCPGVCNAGVCGRGLTGDACGGDAECKSGTCAGGHCTGAVCAALAL